MTYESIYSHPKLSDDVWWMVFDSISYAISITTKEGNILFCNKAMEKLLNRPSEGIIDNCCRTVFNEKLFNKFCHPMEKCPLRLALTSKKREIRVLKAGKIHLNCIIDPILDKNNEITNLIHTISDLSNLKDVTS